MNLSKIPGSQNNSIDPLNLTMVIEGSMNKKHYDLSLFEQFDPILLTCFLCPITPTNN